MSNLRKGGIITYSTCTIIAEENQEVIQAFLESHPDFEQVALDHPCKDIVVNGCLAITPEQYLTDGFSSHSCVKKLRVTEEEMLTQVRKKTMEISLLTDIGQKRSNVTKILLINLSTKLVLPLSLLQTGWVDTVLEILPVRCQ